MKVSYNWLKEYTDIDISPSELVEKIGSQLGEVEEVINLGQKYQDVIVARVVECVKHPNADKLSLCKIDAGSGENIQVVCGAPNVREGLLVAWIPPGATVPVTFDKDPFVLEKREIRGEISNGMLASPNELALSEDHSGILEINDDIAPGTSFAEVFGLDDVIIDIENKMFTHRPDCFGMLGIAREIAGIQQRPFTSPEWYLDDKTTGLIDEDKSELKVLNELPDLVPRLMLQVVKNVNITPSPLWMQIMLSKVGIKSINNIVDITNYIMYLTGQPLHAYDYDKVATLSGDVASIVVRHPNNGETIKLLNGKTIEPSADTIMIATDKKLIGVGGVMGGSETEVDNDTKNIIMECANFDLYSVRRTSMIHGLFTDAVTRFSKGQSPLQNDRVMAYAIDQLVQVAGGMPAKTIFDLKNELKSPEPIQIDIDFINSRLGLDLSAEQAARILINVEFTAEITRGSVLIVRPPFWRTDIEIPEDVIEEIGRLYGFDRLPHELPSVKTSVAIIDPTLKLKKDLRNLLSSLGANEVQTYSFVHENTLKSVGQNIDEAFKIANAISPQLQYYRLSLAPNLLEKVHPNIKLGYDKFALFEIGKVHGKSEYDEDGLPKELGRVSLVTSGDYFEAKRYLNYLYPGSELSFVPIRGSVLDGHKMASQMLAPFEDKKSAVVMMGERPAGVVGEFKRSVRAKLKLTKNCAGFELFLSSFRDGFSKNYVPISKFPSLVQDISLKTKIEINYSEIESAIRISLSNNSPEDVVTTIDCLDIFSKQDGFKNTTFRINSVSYNRTLTSEIVGNLLDKVAQDLAKSLSAERL